ncbi:hypothetical protein DL546_006048 [Coniochaeta pulveracea]|uniref:Uncharacterized protein n=1 Tax=Coniochaeta pulveracea TaxID=177199 RepID=A0A420Y7D3_9PEZI|nr:hypothetical protein DL546_006048 [Coniochaeta pulveracea]
MGSCFPCEQSLDRVRTTVPISTRRGAAQDHTIEGSSQAVRDRRDSAQEGTCPDDGTIHLSYEPYLGHYSELLHDHSVGHRSGLVQLRHRLVHLDTRSSSGPILLACRHPGCVTH